MLPHESLRDLQDTPKPASRRRTPSLPATV
jgi:hypothetical protein